MYKLKCHNIDPCNIKYKGLLGLDIYFTQNTVE